MYYLKLICKAGVWTAAIVVVPLILALFVNLTITNIAASYGIESQFKYWSLVFVLISMWFSRRFLVRWPFPIIFKAKRVIHASPNVIWQQIRPRTSLKNYDIHVTAIRKLGNDKYRYYHRKSDDLNTMEHNFHDRLISREKENEYIEFEVLKDNDSPDYLKTARGFLIVLHDLGDGKTEIATFESHYRPSLFTLYVILFLGARKDDLRQLACACENRENISWATAQMARETLYDSNDFSLNGFVKRYEEFLIVFFTIIPTIIIMIALWTFF